MIDMTQNWMGKHKVIVMIPAFNEEKTIGKVVKEIPREIKNVSEVKVLVMDDCSSDETARAAVEAGADYVFRHKKNRGLGENFKKGIEKALALGADVIVNIDADGQFNPKEIPRLIDPIITNGSDMVTGSRFLPESVVTGMPASKKFGNKKFSKLISKITGQKFTDTQCGFRAYSREAALRLTLQGKFTYTQEVFIDLAEKGIKIREVPITVKYFEKRNSLISGNLKRYGFKSLGIIAKATRDTQPLTFFGLPALVIFALGFIGGGFSFFYWLINHATTPVRTLFQVSVFFMVIGFMLGVLGLLADMLKTIKKNQDEVLYRLKKEEFNGRNGNGYEKVHESSREDGARVRRRWRK